MRTKPLRLSFRARLQDFQNISARFAFVFIYGHRFASVNKGIVKVMTNREVVAALCAKTALPEQTVRQVLNTVIDTIKDAVWDGDRVSLTNFGSFYLAERKERTYANPKPGKPKVRPAHKFPKFVPAPSFEEMVR